MKRSFSKLVCLSLTFVFPVLAQIRVGDTIRVGRGPTRVFLSKDGAKAFTTNRDSEDLSVINLETDPPSQTGTIPLGKAPHRGVMTRDGRQLWIPNYFSDSFSIVTLDSGEVRTIGTGRLPLDLVMDAEETYAYVLLQGNPGGVQVFDVSDPDSGAGYIRTDEIVDGQTVRYLPQSIVFSADGKRLYLGKVRPNNTGPKTVILDVTNGYSETGVIQGMVPMILAPGGETAWFSCPYSQPYFVAQVDLNTNTPDTPIDLLQTPYGMALTRDGDYLLVATEFKNLVTVVDVRTRSIRYELPVGQRPIDITVNEDGDRAYVANLDSGTVTVLNIPPVARLKVTPDTLWPPNGKMVPIDLSLETFNFCNSSPNPTILSVTSNEPAGKEADWEITGPLALKLRASRAGEGTGRIYTITVQAEDECGIAATAKVVVTVPHDQRK